MLPCVKRSFLIDTDAASDDAVALVMALRSAVVEVVAITTVAGNVQVQQATCNALYTVELCRSATPVFAGAGRPLWREHCGAQWFHGSDGLSDRGYPPPKRIPERLPALDAIIATVEAHPGTLEIVTLGPLTNIAQALQKCPEIARKVKRCVVMGGAPCCEGNVTPAAEYNIWCDPEAARIVMRSGLAIELVGWQLSRDRAVLNASEIEYVLSLNNPIARFAIECNSAAQQAFLVQTGEHGIALPDPVAMAVALDPSIVTGRSKHLVEVASESELTRGMTVVDRLNVAADDRNRQVWAQALVDGYKAEIIWTIDNARWKKALYAALQ